MPLLSLVVAALLEATPAPRDEDNATPLPTIEVTTSKRPRSTDHVAAMVSVTDNEDLQYLGAKNLGSALALVPGVEAPAGGDAGPSSAVPAFRGLREFDAYALVVDGVPWGGAFNPMVSTLDLNDIQRIEVVKGAAPVMYGATSFVGVVQALHYPAGEASNQVSIAYGGHDSWRASAALALPSVGHYRQSLAIDSQHLGFADRRESVSATHALYRGALMMDDGILTADANLAVVRDVPPSPLPRSGTTLSPEVPIDANFNPANARIDQNQYQLALGYTRDTAWGEWHSLLSLAHSGITDIRAFLDPDLSGSADTQNQRRRIDDDHLDTHITHDFDHGLTLTVGADALHARGTQTSLNGNGAYTVPLDGSQVPPPTTVLPVNEIGTVDDRRDFLGQYAQLEWRPDMRWDITGGLRLNETRETRFSSDLAAPDPLLSGSSHRRVVKPTVSLGISRQLWRHSNDRLAIYADYRSAYKPAAIDFGPDYQPSVLRPEVAQGYEAGFKGVLLHGRLHWQAEGFVQNFQNLVVPSSTGNLVNAGGERLKGTEWEIRYQLARDLVLAGNLAYHQARYTHYLYTDDASGHTYDVAGHMLPLSPRRLASVGVLYTPSSGFYTTLVGHYVGRRYLDERNTAPVGGYTTLAATLGYRFKRYTLSFEGSNLSNRRPPVTVSEFGSGSFYLLNGRMLWMKFSYSLSSLTN